MDDVAAFGAQGVDRLSGLPVEEDVVVLGLEPVQAYLLELHGLEGEPPLDEVAHELDRLVGPFAGEIGTEAALAGLRTMAAIRVVMACIIVKFREVWKGMVPTP